MLGSAYKSGMRAARVRSLTIGVLIISAVASNSSTAQPTAPRREVRIGVTGVPGWVDPASAIDGATALASRQIFDTLVAWREGTTDIEPALAMRWGLSRDGLTWSFTLRDNVKFSDGTPLTAAEAAGSFGRFLKADVNAAGAPAWGALLRGVPGVIREVRAADARTLQIVLAQPYAPLLTVLAHPALGIARAVTGADGVRYVGTGPYRVVDSSPGRLVLEAVTGYWAGSPRADRLVLLEVASDEHAQAEMDAHALDVWFPSTPPKRLENALSIPGLRVGYLAFQTEKEPFSRKKIRQAVASALDPAVIAAAVDRAGVPLQSFLPPGVWARREGSPILGGGSRDAIAALLRDGGWPRGLKATLLAPLGDDGLATRLAEAIQLMLEAAQMPVQVRTEPGLAVKASREAGEHEMVLAEASVLGGDPHLLLYPLSTSEGAARGARPLNLSFYRNPRLDDVLIRASQLAFRPERQKLYQRAQAMLAEEMPWVPLYVRLVWAVARPEVRGLRLHPTGLHRLWTVSLDTPSPSQ
jgi:peptide/nickel transport system substrate-binding protein